jgi:predicted dehydrogenase
MDKPLNVGILGYGFATATFHAPLVRATPGLKLVAVSTSDPAKVHAALPGVEACSSPEELIARPDLDLIVVPTPNDTHRPLAAQALAAGKHVVVDKPFTLDAAEARSLMAGADAAGKLLAVFHSRRWDADFLTLKDLIARGELGRITHFESHIDRFRPAVRARWRETDAPGAGLWYDLGPHLLDQALALFGEPKRLTLHQAKVRDGAVSDDWFHAVLDYGTLQAVLQATVVAARPGPRYMVHGLAGSFIKDGVDPQEDALKAGGVPGNPGWGTDPRPGTLVVPDRPDRTVVGLPGAYQDYYAAMRDAILGLGPVPVPAVDGLRVMRWLDAGRRSADEGRAVTAER